MPDEGPPPIQALPILWGGDVTPDGKFIILAPATPMGQLVFLINVDDVDGVIDLLEQQCDRARTMNAANNGGIAVPGRVMLGPDGQPMKVVPPSPEVQEQQAKLRSVRDEPPQGDDEAGRRGD